ncbi:hypothetical protein [Bacillus sp. FJAT-27245]|nr:hypothetical protein [Bacillus sp. FJAT-27245]
MEKQAKDVNKHQDSNEKETSYGLKKEESLLSVKFAPPENRDLRE